MLCLVQRGGRCSCQPARPTAPGHLLLASVLLALCLLAFSLAPTCPSTCAHMPAILLCAAGVTGVTGGVCPMSLVWLELLQLMKGRSGVALSQFSSSSSSSSSSNSSSNRGSRYLELVSALLALMHEEAGHLVRKSSVATVTNCHQLSKRVHNRSFPACPRAGVLLACLPTHLLFLLLFLCCCTGAAVTLSWCLPCLP